MLSVVAANIKMNLAASMYHKHKMSKWKTFSIPWQQKSIRRTVHHILGHITFTSFYPGQTVNALFQQTTACIPVGILKC